MSISVYFRTKTLCRNVQYSGIDVDHADYSRGYYIEFAISEYDLSILEQLGYDYGIIHEDDSYILSLKSLDYQAKSKIVINSAKKISFVFTSIISFFGNMKLGSIFV